MNQYLDHIIWACAELETGTRRFEALTGVLAGGAFADQVSSKEAAPDAPEGTAHTLIAIDLATAIRSLAGRGPGNRGQCANAVFYCTYSSPPRAGKTRALITALLLAPTVHRCRSVARR